MNRMHLTACYASQPITPEMVQRTKAFRAANPGATAQSETGILKRSKDSAAMLPHWDKVDAIIDGIQAMSVAGDVFLPKFRDEEADDYTFRQKMTKMTNVYRDIVEGLASKPFEQQVQLTDDSNPPESIVQFLEDVDGASNNITVFAAQTMFQGINSALDWIFIDHADTGENPPRNMDDYKRAGYRPYWSHVLARNVLDAQSTVINGKETLTYFKVLEPGEPDHVREFRRQVDGKVTWALWERDEKPGPDGKAQFSQVGSGVISIGVIPMVPFITGRRHGRSWKIDPPMKDAADLQVELYQQESGLKFAKTLTAYPMLAANGVSPEKDPVTGKPIYKVAVGPNRVLFTGVSSGTGRAGSWSYLEPSSESLKFLAADIDSTIQQLRELGRQPLTASSSNITVITAMVAALKAKSAVKAWALMLKDALENALLITDMWMKTGYVPNVNVFVDFDDFMEGDTEELGKARDRKDISRETYWTEMKRRGVLSADFDPKVEATRLLTELPGDPVESDVE